jgi:hypothetical protein
MLVSYSYKCVRVKSHKKVVHEKGGKFLAIWLISVIILVVHITQLLVTEQKLCDIHSHCHLRSLIRNAIMTYFGQHCDHHQVLPRYGPSAGTLI